MWWCSSLSFFLIRRSKTDSTLRDIRTDKIEDTWKRRRKKLLLIFACPLLTSEVEKNRRVAEENESLSLVFSSRDERVSQRKGESDEEKADVSMLLTGNVLDSNRVVLYVTCPSIEEELSMTFHVIKVSDSFLQRSLQWHLQFYHSWMITHNA